MEGMAFVEQLESLVTVADCNAQSRLSNTPDYSPTLEGFQFLNPIGLSLLDCNPDYWTPCFKVGVVIRVILNL